MARAALDELVEYRTAIYDTRRWRRFESRPGDIFVCTPAKCGTTWTQTIVANLLFPTGELPMPVMQLSPWMEMVIFPEDEVHARLEAQTHRRVIKSHSPADGVPWFDDARYIVVGRDPRDACMSLCNHLERMKMKNEISAQAVSSGVAPMPDYDGDVRGFFRNWLDSSDGTLRLIAGYWERRAQPNVLLVHYNDLKRDLPGEMRRIAAFLGLELGEGEIAACAERCTFDYMREHPEMVGDFDMMFEGGIKGFIFKGTNGRWRDVLTQEDLAAYDACATQMLTPEARDWLEHGRASGR